MEWKFYRVRHAIQSSSPTLTRVIASGSAASDASFVRCHGPPCSEYGILDRFDDAAVASERGAGGDRNRQVHLGTELGYVTRLG